MIDSRAVREMLHFCGRVVNGIFGGKLELVDDVVVVEVVVVV